MVLPHRADLGTVLCVMGTWFLHLAPARAHPGVFRGCGMGGGQLVASQVSVW